MRIKNDISLTDRSLLTPNKIYELLKLCTESSIFCFNGKFYSQLRGLPMGSNLSPLIAEATVQYVFNKASQTCTNPPRVLKWFVDDSFLIIDRKHLLAFFDNINNLGPVLESLKFTKETETNNELPFLDIMIKRVKNKLICSAYRKTTHSNRYLNYK
jgi:hypothetical protein